MAGENYKKWLTIGRTHTGKSHYIDAKFIQKYNSHNVKCLICIAGDSRVYNKYPRIHTLEGLKKWLSDPNPKHLTVKYFDLMNTTKMLENFRILSYQKLLFNMLLIFEDCTEYIRASPPDSIRAYLTNNRASELDIIFTLHSIADTPPFFWRQVNHVILQKTDDGYTSEKQFIERKMPRTKALWEAYCRVHNSKPKNDYDVREIITTRV